MTDLKQTLLDEILNLQEWGKTRSDDEPELRWFARLGLTDTDIGDKVATFVWRDPVDGTRHGWRWEIVPDRLYLFTVHLEEDPVTTDPTEPDDNGARWWGIDEADENRARWWER